MMNPAAIRNLGQLSMGFMRDQFKREAQKPFEQLGDLSAIWVELVPEALSSHTKLISLNRDP